MGNLRHLVVFDLDGTLIDSRRDLANSVNKLISTLGGTPLAEETITRMVGGGAAQLVQRALRVANLVPDTGALERFLDIYSACLLDHTFTYPRLLEALTRSHRVAKLSVLTNKPLAPSERILSGLNLRKFFTDVVGGDGPWPRKPDPAGLEYLMKRARASQEATLLVGDSPIDLETARRAGVSCCLVSYGFGFTAFASAKPDGALHVVADATSLSRAIEAFTID